MNIHLLNLYRNAILTVWALRNQQSPDWTAGFRFYFCTSPTQPDRLCILCRSNRHASNSISTIAASTPNSTYGWTYPVAWSWQEREFDAPLEELTDNWQIVREVII